MAALPYIQLYVADYLADTMHLTTEEHGAYLLLIFNYWQTGKPIPKSRLSRIARLSNDRWLSVEESLSEFFNDNGAEWVHDRIETDLNAVYEAQSQRSAAGKASAEARKRKKEAREQRKVNDRSTSVKNPLNENSTNKDTDTDKNNKTLCPVDEQPDPAKSEPVKIDYSISDSVIEKLNTEADRKFRKGGASRKSIQARLNDRFSKDDLFLVIEFKTAQWLDDPKMSEFLRPETLFQASKFEGYLQAAIAWHNNGRPPHEPPPINQQAFGQQATSTVERNSQRGAEIEARLLREIAELEAEENSGSGHAVMDQDGRVLRSVVG